MAKTQNASKAPEEPKKKRVKRTPKPLAPLKGEALEMANVIESAGTAFIDVVSGANSVPTNHLRAIRKRFNVEFIAVTKARRGSSIDRRKERLERMIQKAQDQLEALMK